MTTAAHTIECPQCQHRFDVETALTQQLRQQLTTAHQAEVAKQQAAFDQQTAALNARAAELQQQQQDQQAELEKRLQSAIAEQTQQINQQATIEAEKKQAEKLHFLQQSLQAKEAENQQLKKLELDKLKLENQLASSSERHQHELAMQAEKLQQQLTAQIRQQATVDAEQAYRNKQLEMEKKLDDQKKLIEEMQRKANQSSMQLQGEVIELEVAKRLTERFPQDEIAEVAKGARGADLVHHIRTPLGEAIGDIVIEIKNTKTFSALWIEKLKEDLRLHGGTIAVIVTEAMPKELSQFGQLDGIWVCQLNEIVSLSVVLRELIVREYQARQTQHNREDKMHLLYDYLTGNEFGLRVQAIVEGFSGLQADIDKERRAMERLWKSREKQIDKVLNNTIDMYGSIKGIGGQAVATVPALELDGLDELDDDTDA